VSSEGLPGDPYNFKIAYDKLVVASGSEPLTFNIKGVKENAIFLREVSHAQEIRRKLLTNLMLSENPGNMHPMKENALLVLVALISAFAWLQW
jgi:NADH:ubiquinone reductase (non-electrogenic)